MKQKMWVNTMQKGIASLNNHTDVQIEDTIELTQEEVAYLFESKVVDTDVIASCDEEVHMRVSHIFGDCIIGNIVTLHEFEFGVAEYDSPFGVWQRGF